MNRFENIGKITNDVYHRIGKKKLVKKGQRKSLERRITDSETLTYEAKKHQITDYVLEKPKVMRFRKSISKYDNICEKRVEKKALITQFPSYK